jgi:ribosomal-protein-alanine N-acetyltransferase
MTSPSHQQIGLKDGTLELSTTRLLLRAARRSDAPDLHIPFSDPQVMKYWSSNPHTYLAQTEAWINKMRGPQNGITDFIIEYTATPFPIAIGKIGIWSLDKREIGFMISRAYWRQGLMSEAMGLVLPWLFKDKVYERIIADVDPRNEASISLLKKCGFCEVGRREKTFEIGGVWVDSLDLELTREGWRARGDEKRVQMQTDSGGEIQPCG